MARTVFITGAASGICRATADACRAEYQRGFTEGVAAVNAQLGAVTAQMQRDVQAQVNAQLAELDARRTRELEADSSAETAALDHGRVPPTPRRHTARRMQDSTAAGSSDARAH